MMTRKDYVQTANILASVRPEMNAETYFDLVDLFANYFSSDNERFNREKFEEACELDEIELAFN